MRTDSSLTREHLGTCSICKREFQTKQFGYLNRDKTTSWLTPGVCTPCDEHRSSADKKQAEVLAALAASWKARCPGEYFATREEELQHPQWEECQEWLKTCQDNGRSLALVGSARKRKTRMAWMLMKRAHLRLQWRWEAWLWTTWTGTLSASYSDGSDVAREMMLKACKVPLLFLDDISHDVTTDRAVQSLKEIMEVRTSNRRPTIITCNNGGVNLFAQFGELGKAIRGRIADYFQPISF